MTHKISKHTFNSTCCAKAIAFILKKNKKKSVSHIVQYSLTVQSAE